MTQQDPIKTQPRTIESTLIEDDVGTCLYNPWFQFKVCTIKTCKNFTKKTKHRCLALDRRSPSGSKFISDSELHLFKYTKTSVSTRLVSMRRKHAVTRVKGILILSRYIAYLEAKYGTTSNASVVFKAQPILDAEAKYPFKVKRLQFKNWMWAFILSKREFRRFYDSVKVASGEEFSLGDTLDMQQSRMDLLQRSVSSELETLRAALAISFNAAATTTHSEETPRESNRPQVHQPARLRQERYGLRVRSQSFQAARKHQLHRDRKPG